jgi:hypothetical protein
METYHILKLRRTCKKSMKNRFSRILGVGLAVALLTSLMMVAVPASALSQPVVTFGTPYVDDVISKVNANYTVRFTLGKQLWGNDATDNATITIGFPSDTIVAAPTATIVASPGWTTNSSGGIEWLSAVVASTNWTYSALLRTVSYTLKTNDRIGESAEVRINITAGITNPTVAGSYTVTVGTSKTGGTVPIEAAVTSAAYTIIVPTPPSLGGLVTVYNPAGVLMTQYLGSGGIVSGLGAVTGTGWTVKVGPGTYTDAPTISVASTTLVATGTAAETIISGAVTMSNVATVTVKNLTLTGGVTASNSTSGTITGCVLKPPVVAGPAVMLTIADIGALTPFTVTSTSIAATGTTATTGIASTNATVTVSSCTLTVDLGGTAVVVNSGTVTLKDSTVTGSSGTGVTVAGGTATISGSTFDTLDTALNISGSSTAVTLLTSTIKNSASNAIYVNAAVAGGVVIKGNTISGTKASLVPPGYYALSVGTGAATANVSMLFNNITGNAANVYAATAVVDASHNWWGAATGPALGTVSATVVTLPYLGGAVTTAADIAVGKASLIAKTTASVDVSIVTATTGVPSAAGIIAVGNYAANPVTVAPLYTALDKGYYDVYVGSPANTTDIVTIMFYNAKVTKDSVVYMWSALKGVWVKIDPTLQGVNTVSGYVFATIKGGAAGVSSIVDLAGTPFVLVEEKTAAAPALTSPALGAYDVSIQPMFVWSAVTGVIRYEFALSEDSAFKILKWSANVVTNMYDAPEELKYSTTYYWRVRGIITEPYLVGPTWVTPASLWSTGIFTTEAEPVEAAPTTITTPAPKVDVTVEPAKVTVEPSAPVIPDYMLWIIIAVGAVLIIALIVLIVRTRRTA